MDPRDVEPDDQAVDDLPGSEDAAGDTVNVDAIPPELKQDPRWVCWRKEVRSGKPTKVPIDPKHPARRAAVDQPETWGTFEQAVRTYKRGRVSGIGFVLIAEDDILVFDLDHCRNPETGAVEDWAQAIIDRLNSYTEISPSATGIHIFVRGKLPGPRRRKDRVEVYEAGRYMTVTGWRLEGGTSGH